MPAPASPTPRPHPLLTSARLPSAPAAYLLGNDRVTTLVTNVGSGYVSFGDLALTRWAPDRTRDADGYFFYVRDRKDDTFWSIGHQPVRRATASYEIDFEPGCVTLRQQTAGIAAEMRICVNPQVDMDLRLLTLTNTTDRIRHLDVTSYAEIVLNTRAADEAHPAFSKLFVQTENASANVLLAQRRLRSPDDQPGWAIHTLATSAFDDTRCSWETDRKRFIGRGRRLQQPQALMQDDLSGTVGNVLDAITSLRYAFTLAPGESVQLAFGLGGATSRAKAERLAQQFSQWHDFEAHVAQAKAHAHYRLNSVGLNGSHAGLAQQLIQPLLHGPNQRSVSHALFPTPDPRPLLDSYDLTSHTPYIFVPQTSALSDAAFETLLAMQRYWQGFHRNVVLVFVLDTAATSQQTETLIAAAQHASALRIISSPLSTTDLDHLKQGARWIVDGSLHLEPPASNGQLKTSTVQALPVTYRPDGKRAQNRELRFANGYGGFRPDGTTYHMRVLGHTHRPPLPWANVIANEQHGFLVTESGAGYTWSANSRENRLTPWYNDPVSDPIGEALYLRDEAAGVFWSPQPDPVPTSSPYDVEHGFGYTRFRNTARGLEQCVTQFVPRHGAVKITRLDLTNTADETRTIDLFAYQRLVLGGVPHEAAPWTATHYDAETAALLAHNPVNNEFADRITFAKLIGSFEKASYTTDRSAFLGQHGDVSAPVALATSETLDGFAGMGMDPCFAQHGRLDLAPGKTETCYLLLGQAAHLADAKTYLEQYSTPDVLDAAFTDIQTFWTDLLSTIQIQTPAPELDLMVNGWLAYQNLSCRMWGRSAYYQSGGAYGYRDQLQDASALIYQRPDITREQILRHARHQFVEGDVLHWWHPPLSKGIRTRFSDDLLWLPYITAFYVQTTGDTAILHEEAGFVTARALQQGEDETFVFPEVANQTADVYEHCCMALDRSLTTGPHGLPLMGTGDWNDGMNRVGREGKGESVWLGFFIYHILRSFIPLCEQRGDAARVQRYTAYQSYLRDVLNTTGWDGAWYRRAYYDNGAVLGSTESDECQIDALAQAWAVLSGVASDARATQALDAMEERLVSEEAGIIRLLTPAFDKTPHDPGYIKGYLPGVRENGGQYTHAALWAVRALTEAGRNERAAPLLQMLSPVSHTRSQATTDRYQTEPYVIAADVYGEPPHIGRGGWTWYTGSAGWMYRVALESVLGLRLYRNQFFRLQPCIPDSWPGFQIRYRLPSSGSLYHFDVQRSADVSEANTFTLDGEPLATSRIPVLHDGNKHHVLLILPAKAKT